jgi:hypothetical protein
MMTPNLSSSFLSFPTQSSSSPRLSIHRRPSTSGPDPSPSPSQTQTQNSPSSPFRHISYPHQRHRPTPIDLYALPTLEALPTPPSTSSQSHISFEGSEGSKTRRLNKTPSQGELTGRIMRSFTKKRSEKEKEKEKEKDKDKSNQKNKDKKVNTSFLPFDTDPPVSASRRPSASTPTQLPRPPTGMSSRSKPRPAPLDPAIFGHRIQVVKAENPIDMVLRLDSEARVQAITRSFSPFGGDQAPPPRPPPLDPSVFGTREMKAVRAEDPIEMVSRLEEETKMKAIKQSFTPFGDDRSTSNKQRSRGQSVGQGPDRQIARATESRNGSVRQRNHGTMPSIQGVIEGDVVRTDRERRDSMKLPMMAPPSTGMPLRRSPTATSFQGNRDQAHYASPTSTTPREFFYPRPESPRIKRSVIPGFTNRSPPSHTATIDESPTLGSIHLPEITRYQSLSPSFASRSDSAWQSNTYVDPDEERLTALEILEELNGGMEDGWEFGVLDTQRIQAGLDNRNFKQYGMTTTPYSPLTTIISAGHHKDKDGGGSIKEVANSVRSWRESRKKGRPPSEKSVKSKTGSLKPKPSYDGLQPLYEVHYSIEKDMMIPPPIPPRAPSRSLPPLKVHIERVVSSGSVMSGIEVPIVLDSPVKSKFPRDSSDTVRRHDIPESVILR